MDIPFFGHAARAYDTIRIDRSKGSEAVPLMLAEARAALDRGARIIIFPEGTRKAPLADPDYRWGVVRLYEALGVPVVPVALNSGLFWGRNSLLLWPGRARARFLAPIPAGLAPETFRETLMGAIETETDRLILAAVDEGLKRPLSADLRARIEALRARAGR
jgi:1-acyl-sn-glycerol-3-phosphate acyltransferase